MPCGGSVTEPAPLVAGGAGRPGAPTGLAAAAWTLFALQLLLQVTTWRSFYGDGAAFFVSMLQHETLILWPPERIFASGLITLPMWLGLQAGITDIDSLQALFALGLLMPWPIALWLCWRLAPAQFWLPVAACGLAYLNSCLLAFSNALAAHAMLWPVLTALVFVRPLTRFAAGVLVGGSLLLLYSYESQLFLGPPLAILALWRLRHPETPGGRLSLLLSGLLLLGSAWMALQGILAESNSANRGGYVEGLLSLAVKPPWTVGFSALLVGVAAVLLLRPRLARLAGQAWCVGLLLTLLVVWGVWPLIAPGLFRPLDQYLARGLNLAVPMALFPLALLARRHAGWFADRLSILHGAALALLLAQSIWQVSATVQWQGYLASLRTLLTQHSGPVRLEAAQQRELEGGPQALRFHIAWTLPYLSLLLAPDGRVQSLFWASSEFQPMDPTRPGMLPDLSRYGFDMTDYLEALRRQGP